MANDNGKRKKEKVSNWLEMIIRKIGKQILVFLLIIYKQDVFAQYWPSFSKDNDLNYIYYEIIMPFRNKYVSKMKSKNLQ